MTRSLTPPSPDLTDGVIRLREWSPDDAEAVRAAVQDSEITRFTGIPLEHSIEGVRRWLSSIPEDLESGTAVNLAIVSADEGRLLGSVGVERFCSDPAIAEVGYWVCAEARGNDVATRAVKLIVAWAADAMELARIEITTHEDNLPSLRVAEKCGFTREGVMRAYRDQRGERVDLVMLSLLPSEIDWR